MTLGRDKAVETTRRSVAVAQTGVEGERDGDEWAAQRGLLGQGTDSVWRCDDGHKTLYIGPDAS